MLTNVNGENTNTKKTLAAEILCQTCVLARKRKDTKKTLGDFQAFSAFEGGRWDSNPRPSEPQSVTLTD